MQTDPFKEYLKQQEPDKKYKGYAWQTAIGLQAVDGLKPSEYLVDAAIQNIEGKITLDEVKNLLDSYYEEKPQKNHDRTEEADKVSIRIAKILFGTCIFLLHQMSISQFTENYLPEYMTTQEKSVIIILQKRMGAEWSNCYLRKCF